MRSAIAIRRLSIEAAQRALPVHLEGVTTCVLTQLHALVIQDATAAVYVLNKQAGGEFPEVGDRVEVEGVTGPDIINANQIKRLGAGRLPEFERPSWDQLINGSLDCRLVEVRGVIESLLHRGNGWSRVSLRTKDGTLRVELRRAGIQPESLAGLQDAVVRLRGCMFADRDVGTLRVKPAQVRMHSAQVIVEEPAPADLSAVPQKSAASLMQYDPESDAFKRVRITGQIVFVRGNNCFVMENRQGLRLLDVRPAGLAAGDLIEAVGFPQWGYASPCLRNVLTRKTGHAALPAPEKLPSEELIGARHDATLVTVEGVLASARRTPVGHVFEIQSGSWRFLARLASTNPISPPLRLGSRLALTGVYCAQSGNTALGEDVAPIDLLLQSAADIRVLAAPSWWTLRRLLALAAVLGLLLVAALLWGTQLRRQVEQRTV
ncbi:MAG: hypothetical protein EPO07_09895, partial [Verrucomicrobia bacterium]